MAAKLDITVTPLEGERVFRGRSLITCEQRVFDDGARLARDFAQVKGCIEGRVMPVVSAVVAFEPGEDGRYRYFMGDEVARNAAACVQDDLEDVCVPAGTLVAVIPVRFRLQASAALSAARARRSFYEDWLPRSGYESAAPDLGFSDIELYHYRRRRFRRARKLVMELMFVVRPA